MTKVLKIIGNSIFTLLEYIFILIIAFSFLIRTSEFQTFLAHKGAAYLSNKINSKVSIGKVDIALFSRVYFDDLYIEDQRQDTLFFIKNFYVSYDLKELLKSNLQLDEIRIDQATVGLIKRQGSQDLNLKFLIDAFVSDEPKDRKNDFELKVGKLKMTRSHLIFRNESKELTNNGINFADLDLKNIHIDADNIVIHPKDYAANFNSIGFLEKSGFNLHELQGATFFSEQGLSMKNVKLKTDNSDINLKTLQLQTNRLSDFKLFVENVAIVSELDTSSVSFQDIAYFSPELQGMNDIVLIAGSTNKNIQNFEMNNIYLNYGEGTIIKGDFFLPDFKQLSTENIAQKIDYFIINSADLEKIKLPDKAAVQHIKWPNSLNSVEHIEGKNLTLNGSLNKLNIQFEILSSNVGAIEINEGLTLKTDADFKSFFIQPNSRSKKGIRIKNLALNKILNNSDFRQLNGQLGLNAINIDSKGVKAKQISGTFNNTEIYDYTYNYIILDGIDYTMTKSKKENQNELSGDIYIRDENLDLSFKGLLSIGEFLDIQADLSVECAMLENINPEFNGMGELITNLELDMKGQNFNDFMGNLSINSLFYEEGDSSFYIDDFKSFMSRGNYHDSIIIRSQVLDLDVFGKIDYEKVIKNINNQIGVVFPAFGISDNNEVTDTLSYFDYSLSIKSINNILNIAAPSFQIANQTKLSGSYDGKTDRIELNAKSGYFTYKKLRLDGINLMQEISNSELLTLIDAKTLKLRDSTAYKNIHFTGLASDGTLDSQLLFDDLSDSRSNVEWLTNLQDELKFDIDIYPSYINFTGHKWTLDNIAQISYSDSCFFISNLKLEHDKQYISANGQLSNSIYDKLYLDIMNFNLSELGNVLGSEMIMSGIANISGYVTTPFENLQFHGEAVIEDFYLNKSEVGVVGFGVDYESKNKEIGLFGDIFYRGLQTFQVNGLYSLRDDKRNQLNAEMLFKQTDISVVNEFLDPDLINSLQGKINGRLKLTGTPSRPILNGEVDFNEGMFNLAILGPNMYFNGKIKADKDGFFIDKMPIKDQEGNTGFISGSLLHDNFKNFVYDIVVNLQDHPTLRLPSDQTKPLPLERFLVMNTSYDIDAPYYGDAYVTGIVEISGSSNDLSILVNAQTKRGTRFVLPMYGPTTIEEDGFITFKKEGSGNDEESKVDLTGLDLTLNLDVTDDAEVKVIFDEKVGDEITAYGSGDLSITVDQFNELSMNGTYTVSNGVYNFAMGPYKQNFKISPGGTVNWSGDPYNAILNLNAFYKTMANLSVVMPDVIENQTSANEEINSYITLTGSLMNPEILFDLEAPKANESGKAILTRIRSDKDELNKQFFSILISKSFMPLSGQAGESSNRSSAFLDLASTQINNILNKVAEGYNMNVNLENDEFSGRFYGEFGMSKYFLDGRLLISGSFGMGTAKAENGSVQNDAIPNQSMLIGDVKIEYLLNEKGTFRMNVFNESNNNHILQNEGRAQFTQGIGISYKEDFHNLEDFKLFQFFANAFRRKENWVDVRGKRDNRIPIPEEYLNNNE